MIAHTKAVAAKSMAATLVIMLGAMGTASAGPGHGGGGGGGGFHGSSGFHGFSGYHGASGFRGGARSSFSPGRVSGYYGGAGGAYRGRYPGGYGGYYHGGGNYHGGGYFHGYHGYPGYRGGYGYGGWWGGLGLGLFLTALPLYYETLWWNGIPYYYANSSYYVWDGDVQQYQAVVPPAGLAPGTGSAPADASGPDAGSASAADTNSDLYAYPKAGQSPDQQASDRMECRRWAASESRSDAESQGFRRAEAACLQAHNYSVD